MRSSITVKLWRAVSEQRDRFTGQSNILNGRSSVSAEVEHEYQRLLEARIPDDKFLTARDKRRLKQPVTQVEPHNIFQSHLTKHTIYENETDRKLIRKGVMLRSVGLTEGARLTEMQITGEEDRLGIKLPAPWREVYKHFNGGWTHMLRWGDLNDPRVNDPEAICSSGHEYFALEDVVPLRDHMGKEMDGYDWGRLDPRLFVIGGRYSEAMILDYRHGDDPKVCRGFFWRTKADPMDDWEQDDFTQWWPNMRVFFRGLYLQDRIF